MVTIFIFDANHQYKGFQEIAEVYIRLQWFTGDCKRIKGSTTVYRVLQRFTPDYKGLQEITKCSRRLQAVTGDYNGLQGIARVYKGLQWFTVYSVLQGYARDYNVS